MWNPRYAPALIARALQFQRDLPSERVLVARHLNEISGSEILVRVRDSGQKVVDARHWVQTKRGDLINNFQLGWKWGDQELIAKFWRIFICPDIPMVFWRDWTRSHQQGDEVIQKRVFYFNFDAPNNPDAKRLREIIELTDSGRILLTKGEQDALKRLKRARPSPFAEHVWQPSSQAQSVAA